MLSKRSGKALTVAVSLLTFSALTALCLLAIVSHSSAQQSGASDFSLGGNATLVPGNGSPTGVEATTTGPAGFGSVGFAIPAGLKVSQLSHLSTDYRFKAGTCRGGSPRFTANVTNGTSTSSIFFYLGGPAPNYPDCASGDYTNSGNLATPTSPVDASSLNGGSLNEPFSDVQAQFGDYTVTALHLDVDDVLAGASGNQTVDFDNTQVNERLVTYEPPPPSPAGLVPLHGASLLAEPVGATGPKVKEPGQTAFHVLTELSLIPVGSTIDTRGSRVRLTAAIGDFLNPTPDHPVDFYKGLFKITQKPGTNARATAKLIGKLACGKKKKGGKKAEASAGDPQAVVSRKRRRRRLWGSGSGNYSTSGGGGTGSVRGTTWLTKDTCKGTKFKVTEGLGITVFDFKKKKKIKLGPGDKYFAAK